MERRLFIDEVHHYIDSTFKDFCKYQDVARGILCEFDRICKLKNFDYWLAYGTLLGAIRDHNLIPWDYDIDVFFPADKREDLLEVLQKDLNSSYSYVYWTNSPHYPTTCLRVFNKDYTWKALHVDVYFLMGTPNEEKKRRRFVKRAMYFDEVRNKKYIIENFPPSVTWKKWLLLIYYRIRYFFIPEVLLNQIEKKLLYNYPLSTSDYWMPLGARTVPYFAKNVFGKSIFHIESDKFPVPSGYQEMLSQIYGKNWNDYLPIENRFEEFYTLKKVMDERQSDYVKKIRK